MSETPHPSADLSLQPWSHRRSYPVRILITVLAGVASGVVGTMAHRMGASQNIPYGLVLAFLILGISTWCARARCGAIGIGFHLIASSGAVWCMAMYGPGGDAMIPIGFSVEMPFFVEHAGNIWLYGEIILQVLMLFLPARWFVIPPRQVLDADGSGEDAGGDDTDTDSEPDDGITDAESDAKTDDDGSSDGNSNGDSGNSERQEDSAADDGNEEADTVERADGERGLDADGGADSADSHSHADRLRDDGEPGEPGEQPERDGHPDTRNDTNDKDAVDDNDTAGADCEPAVDSQSGTSETASGTVAGWGNAPADTASDADSAA